MDFNRLALFVRVIELGSLTKAAYSLRQPKSRVSRNLAALEKELGVALIYRTTRQFSPTQAGQALYQRCRQQIYELETAAEALKENAQEVAGHLRITAAEDMGSILLGPLIAELKTLHTKVTTEAYLSNEIVDLIKDRMDLAIRIGALEDTGLKARAIGHTESILVASPAYLKDAPRVESVADLAKHPALVFSPESEDQHWILVAAGKKDERVKLQPHCTANNPKILLDLVLAGQGVALMPAFLCAGPLKAGTLKHLLKAYSGQPSPIQFVWPGQRELSPKVRAFIDLGVKRLSKYFVKAKPGLAKASL